MTDLFSVIDNISNRMLWPAPPLLDLLPTEASFLQYVSYTAHNIGNDRFSLGFLSKMPIFILKETWVFVTNYDLKKTISLQPMSNTLDMSVFEFCEIK